MPVGYPLVVAVGSKGGVGTTTLAAGLVRSGGAPIVGVDLTVSNDLSRVLGQRASSISSLVRHRGRMPAQVERALRRRVALLSLDLEGTMYVDRHIEMLRMLASRRAVVVDAGSAFATTGRRSLDPYLSLATHVLLVLIPDVRAVARAERLLARWPAHGDRTVLVENMAGGSPSLPQAVRVPRAPAGHIGRLMEGPSGEAIRALASELMPQAVADGAGGPPERGIIRSWVSNWNGKG